MRGNGVHWLSVVAVVLAAFSSTQLLAQDTTATVSDSAATAADIARDTTAGSQVSSAPAATPGLRQDTTFVVIEWWRWWRIAQYLPPRWMRSSSPASLRE